MLVVGCIWGRSVPMYLIVGSRKLGNNFNSIEDLPKNLLKSQVWFKSNPVMNKKVL